MPERVLSDDEVKALGLDQPTQERELSDDEVKSLGLETPTPVRVPSPTGWRDADKPESPTEPNRMMRDAGKQEEAMWSALASAAHGPAMAMEGPVNGAIASGLENLKMLFSGQPADPEAIRAAYRGERNRVEGAQKENLKRFPLAPAVGAVLTSPGSAPSMLGRLGINAGQGALYGFGSSDADLTVPEAQRGPEVDKALKAAEIGGGIGLGAGLLGEALQIPGRMLAKRAQGITDATHAAELAAETEARGGAVASTTGAEGNKTANAMKLWDRLQEALTDPAATEENRAGARAYLDSDEGKALFNQVLANYIEAAPQQMGLLRGAREAKLAAIAANKPDLIRQAAEAAAEAKLGDTSQVTGRLGELARRGLPAAIGTAMGGPLGTVGGALVSGVTGKPNVIVNNMLKSPGMVPYLTKGAAMGMGTGDAMSRVVPSLAPWSRFLKEDEGSE